MYASAALSMSAKVAQATPSKQRELLVLWVPDAGLIFRNGS